MRFIFGILVGAVLTIAGAYMHDSSLSDGSSERLVNWGAAGNLANVTLDNIRDEFNRLTSK